MISELKQRWRRGGRGLRGFSIPCLVAALTSASSAQDNPVLFLERAYFSPLSPSNHALWFEGQPTMHYFIFNTFADTGFQSGRAWGGALSLSGLFVLRMRRDASEPITTPSYHIGPRLQLVKVHRATPESHDFSMSQFMTGIMHYSNGQSGCFFFGYTRASSGQCFVADGPDEAVAALRRPNTLSGDFSTTYIPVNVAYRRGTLVPQNHRLRWQTTVGAELQIHPRGGLVGAMTSEQAAEYGQHEWTVFGEWECRRKAESGAWRLSASFTQRFGGGVREPINRGVIEGSFIFESAPVGAVRLLQKIPGLRNIVFRHTGLFVRMHSGFDYYNINFKDARRFVSAGIVIDPNRLDGLNSTHKLTPDTRVGRCIL